MTMENISGQRRRSQRGSSALLEGALSLLTLMIMIIFVVEMGRMLLYQQFFTERARAAARNATVSHYSASAIQNYVCYNGVNAPAGSPPGFLGLAPSMVTVSRLGTAGNWDDRIQVTISNYPMFDLIPLFKHNYTVPPVTVTIPVNSLGAVN